MKKLLTIFTIIVFVITGCSKETTEEIPEKTAEGSPYIHPRVQNMAFQEQDNGWVYYMSIQYHKTDINSPSIAGNYDKNETDVYANFDGINLKYKEIENAYLPVVDGETGEEISQGSVKIPTLTTLQTVKDEVKAINDFLFEKKFTSPISVADLQPITCDNIDKQLLVDLYNQALENEPQGFGMFGKLPAANLLQVKDSAGRTWQGGYMGNYGSTGIVRFECIQDKQHFSNLIEAGTADETQTKIQANLDQMETWIMDTQVFSIEDIEWVYPNVMDEQIITSLNSLLQKLYTGNKK